MKTRIVIIIAVILTSWCASGSKESAPLNNPTTAGSVNVFASPDLYNLVSNWANAYSRQNSGVTIHVVTAHDLSWASGLGFVSGESLAALKNKENWNVVVGREVIVPIMNSGNPMVEEIEHNGLNSEKLSRMFQGTGQPTWGQLLGNSQNIPLHYYWIKDKSISSGIENFLHKKYENTGVEAASAQEMISAIQKDPEALGFCSLVDLVNQENQQIAQNIKIVPIDKNGNGKIDFMEDIYDNLQTFSRGVWIGKYPKAFSGNIYSVASEKPKNEAEIAFLTWVLTDGQQFLSSSGYCDLVSSERQTQLDKVNEVPIVVSIPSDNKANIILIVFLALIAFGILSFFLDMAIRNYRKKRGIVQEEAPAFHSVLDENSIAVPKGLYFDKTHTWAFMEQDGSVRVGIDDFLQHITGPLSRIGLKPAGVKIKKGDPLLTIIQNGKHLTIYSPVSGKIISQNINLLHDSSAINSSPYADGWVYTIEPTNWLLEIQLFTMAENYKAWLKEEFSRLKEFFATTVRVNTPEYATIVLQDGGAIRDNLLAELGPEVWEDFQTKFIDAAR